MEARHAVGMLFQPAVGLAAFGEVDLTFLGRSCSDGLVFMRFAATIGRAGASRQRSCAAGCAAVISRGGGSRQTLCAAGCAAVIGGGGGSR